MTTVNERIERLYREEADRMWRALLAYAGDPDIASDALAEAFTQALHRGAEVREVASWVWSASFRIAAGELKHRRTTTAFHGPEPSYELDEPLPHLFAALAQISPNQRLAVVLHDYADRPTDEIARILAVTRPTVHVHLSAGRKRLRRLLEPDR